MSHSCSRRPFLKTAAATALGAALAPAIVGRARAAAIQLKLSSSQANDPKFGNGRVYWDNLMKRLRQDGLNEQIDVAFFPDNQLGQEIDVINSLKFGIIDMMVAGSSIATNVVPLVGTFDLGYLWDSYPHQGRAFAAGAAKPLEEALLKDANLRILGWSYDFGSRSVLARKQVREPEDLAGLKIRTLPSPVVTECVRLMGAAATPLAMGEIYTALQAGVLDGLEHNAPTVLAGKYYETAKFYSLTEHIFPALAIYMSNQNFTAIELKLRDRFLAAAQEAVEDTRQAALAANKEALGMLADKGVTVGECDRAAFRKRVAVQTENFMKAHPDSKPIIEKIRAAA
jgi:TRAP-type C4-dicarboxylate transport system substrate-binding protein